MTSVLPLNLPETQETEALLANPERFDNLDFCAYGELFGSPDFETIGLEDPQTSHSCSVASKAHTLYRYLRDVFTPMGMFLDEVPHSRIITHIKGAERELRRLSFRIESFEETFGNVAITDESFKEHVFVAGVAQRIKDLDEIIDVMCVERNRIAAAIMVNRMEEKGYRRGAIIMGAAHMDPNKMAVTLQKVLADHSCSYIVLKPPPCNAQAKLKP